LSPNRPCLEPHCPYYAEVRGRCRDHYRQRERERNRFRRADAKQGAAIRVYHSAKWLNTRRRVLADNPICEDCGKELATEVDHRTPLSEGGDPYALDNLSPKCGPCHWRKTAREAREAAGRGRFDDAA
jgi:5-methylcytosine-specific restriction enzyme A